MKRMHIHISAADMDATRTFYSALFGQAPSVDEPDYMKWMLDDPRINIAVSQRDGATRGVDHVGIGTDFNHGGGNPCTAFFTAEFRVLNL